MKLPPRSFKITDVVNFFKFSLSTLSARPRSLCQPAGHSFAGDPVKHLDAAPGEKGDKCAESGRMNRSLVAGEVAAQVTKRVELVELCGGDASCVESQRGTWPGLRTKNKRTPGNSLVQKRRNSRFFSQESPCPSWSAAVVHI